MRLPKVALIAGITGQDGAYLAQLLLSKGYIVHGMRQPVAVPDTERLEYLLGASFRQIHLHYCDLIDPLSVFKLVKTVQPDEIYNLAAQSHVHISFDVPDLTLQINGAGAQRIMQAILMQDGKKKMKFFQASTSELFGDVTPPQTEKTPFNPRSPYAAAKMYAYQMVRINREAYGLYATNGIMFNHESPLRGEEFVTRKIAMAAAKISCGQQDYLRLGNLDARRDWSHASDIMEAAWRTLQQDQPDDYILSSGRSHTVRDFAQEAFSVAGLDLVWDGSGAGEIARDRHSGKILIKVDPELFRPLEVENLLGDASKAQAVLRWQPKISFKEIVREMVEAELEKLEPPVIEPERFYA